MVKVDLKTVEKVVTPLLASTKKTSSEALDVIERDAGELIHPDSGVLKAYAGVTSRTRSLFGTLEEFAASARARLQEYEGKIPEKLYQLLNKSIADNNYDFNKVISQYYSGLTKCKTTADVKAMYPEFAHFDKEAYTSFRNTLQSAVPKSVCDDARKFASRDERIEYILNFFEKNTSLQAKKWEVYPEILKVQKETAENIADGLYAGNPYAYVGGKMFNHPQMPIRYKLLNPEVKDKVILKCLRDIYIDGKTVGELENIVVDGVEIRPLSLNNNDFIKFSDKNWSLFRKTINSLESEAKGFKILPDLTKDEISSAVLTRTWTKSGLRRDFGNACQFGSGWSNIRYILQKEKYPESHAYPSEQIIDAIILENFKLHKAVKTKNPFEVFENSDKDVSSLKKFVNMCYKFSKLRNEDARLLKSDWFKAYKEQYDVDAMKKSWENIEQSYKKAFFKYFWWPERVERFAKALNESYELASKNIEVSEDLLSKAMLEAVD